MERLDKLLAELADTDKRLDALLAADDLNEAQLAEHDALVAGRAKTTAAIERERSRLARDEERQKLEADLRKQVRTVPAEPRRLTQPDSPASSGPAKAVRTDAEGRPTAFYEATDEEISFRIGESADAIRRKSYRDQRRQNTRALKAAGYQPWGEFKSCAEFVRAGLTSHGHPKFEDRVHKHYAAVAGMSEGVGSDGGYTVMPEFASGIIDRVYGNNLWSMTDNYSVTGNNLTFYANAETSRANGSRHGGLRGYWMNEGGSITSTKPTLREVSLKLVKLGVLVYLTQELIDDGGSALESYIAKKAAEEFNFMIGDSLINGTGVGQPLGLLNWPSLVSVAKETGQPAATLETENILKMYSRFYAPNLGNATWLHNQDIGPELFTMTIGVGTGGQVTYMPAGGLSGSPYASLMGRPMLPTEFSATLGTQGDILLADMGQMLSISKGGVNQQVSMHVQFLTQQLALLFTMRLNAGPWESAPITPYKGTSNTQSNCLALDTRS